ncbi:cupin domain-containing protein [Nonomuraea rubra]|uniref:cupin domain-containing protein n=1 Tax=Nonomuraea rubra TaxID=46180 RepID=UPI0031EB72EB
MTPPSASQIRTPAITTPDTQQTVSFLGELYHLRVTGDETGGAFAVVETTGRRGHGSPMHVHRSASETFVVLEGELRVIVDGREHLAGAGSARRAARGAAPRVRGDQRLRPVPDAAPRPGLRRLPGRGERRP